MTPTPRSLFNDARTRAEQERTDLQRRAVRTVAGNARDRAEFVAMVSMLGLDQAAHQPVSLNARLATYVHQVAAAIGVPAEATGHEVTDTATAYIGLDQHSTLEPDRDLMLVWDERLGWYIAVETTPSETPMVVAYLDGDTVPAPAAVARFVANTANGERATRIRPVQTPTERTALAEKMATVC